MPDLLTVAVDLHPERIAEKKTLVRIDRPTVNERYELLRLLPEQLRTQARS